MLNSQMNAGGKKISAFHVSRACSDRLSGCTDKGEKMRESGELLMPKSNTKVKALFFFLKKGIWRKAFELIHQRWCLKIDLYLLTLVE